MHSLPQGAMHSRPGGVLALPNVNSLSESMTLNSLVNQTPKRWSGTFARYFDAAPGVLAKTAVSLACLGRGRIPHRMELSSALCASVQSL